MADLKISQFADGGTVQTTDQIATNRGGTNTRVVVGSAAALDTGTGDGDIPIISSGLLPVASGYAILTDVSVATGADPVYNIIALTLAEYGAIVSPDAKTVYLITDSMTYANAANIPYDNSISGLMATNVQDALDELAGLV